MAIVEWFDPPVVTDLTGRYFSRRKPCWCDLCFEDGTPKKHHFAGRIVMKITDGMYLAVDEQDPDEIYDLDLDELAGDYCMSSKPFRSHPHARTAKENRPW